MKHHGGAVIGQQQCGLFGSCLRNGVALNAVAFPSPYFIAAESTRYYRYLFSYHERRIETNAKLANDVYIVALLFGVFGLKVETVRMGDAQVCFKFVLAHANAGICNRYSAGILVEANLDEQIAFRDT